MPDDKEVNTTEMGEELVEDQLGIPPYFKPTDAKNAQGHHGQFYATVIGFDNRDKDFGRWVFSAKKPVQCYIGKKGESKPVLVDVGEQFTVSKSAQLNRLVYYIDLDVEITFMDKKRLDGGKTLWVMRLMSPPAHLKIAKERQMQQAFESNESKRLDIKNGTTQAQNAEFEEGYPF